MPTLLEKVAAIKKALSIPPSLELVPAIGTALEMIGLVAERGEPLPQLADRIIAAVGCTVEVATAAQAGPSGE